MSPIVKKKQGKISIPSKYLLIMLTFFCIGIMILSFTTDTFKAPVTYVTNHTIIPLQKGFSSVGTWLLDKSQQLAQLKDVLEENQQLKDEIAELTLLNTQLQQDKYELNELRELFQLDSEYDEYNKVGARIIGKDTGNWYTNFIIDKGSEDGIQENFNVIASGGLVGLVTEVGSNYAKVTTIINDNVNTSGATLATNDNLIVSGDLSMMLNGTIMYSQLIDSADKVVIGDKIVTSSISDYYLPGILIGYITSIDIDANNLTKSGALTPAVDFEHLEEVLVITQTKQQIE
ncbi:MAG: rod shape-determining protein MreC [Eubacteriales bacterium]